MNVLNVGDKNGINVLIQLDFWFSKTTFPCIVSVTWYLTEPALDPYLLAEPVSCSISC